MSFPDDLSHLVRTDEPLGPLVWLGIGGPARFFAEPVDAGQVSVGPIGARSGTSGSNFGGR